MVEKDFALGREPAHRAVRPDDPELGAIGFRGFFGTFENLADHRAIFGMDQFEKPAAHGGVGALWRVTAKLKLRGIPRGLAAHKVPVPDAHLPRHEREAEPAGKLTELFFGLSMFGDVLNGTDTSDPMPRGAFSLEKRLHPGRQPAESAAWMADAVVARRLAITGRIAGARDALGKIWPILGDDTAGHLLEPDRLLFIEAKHVPQGGGGINHGRCEIAFENSDSGNGDRLRELRLARAQGRDGLFVRGDVARGRDDANGLSGIDNRRDDDVPPLRRALGRRAEGLETAAAALPGRRDRLTGDVTHVLGP